MPGIDHQGGRDNNLQPWLYSQSRGHEAHHNFQKISLDGCSTGEPLHFATNDLRLMHFLGQL